MTPQEIDRIECAIRHIQTAADVDPWACDIAVEAMKAQLSREDTTSDLISRQAAIDVLKKISFSHWFECGEHLSEDTMEIEIINSNKALEEIEALPSAQPKIKPISYQDCANAMMMMWMDDVLTDGEYRRIMDKLNDHESRRENR